MKKRPVITTATILLQDTFIQITLERDILKHLFLAAL